VGDPKSYVADHFLNLGILENTELGRHPSCGLPPHLDFLRLTDEHDLAFTRDRIPRASNEREPDEHGNRDRSPMSKE
jgi:hypothetical protein